MRGCYSAAVHAGHFNVIEFKKGDFVSAALGAVGDGKQVVTRG